DTVSQPARDYSLTLVPSRDRQTSQSSPVVFGVIVFGAVLLAGGGVRVARWRSMRTPLRQQAAVIPQEKSATAAEAKSPRTSEADVLPRMGSA
ncbi:unnamed protein product, partial [Ectocarpus fasciculatus]